MAERVLTLKLRGEKYRLAIDAVPIQERLLVRKATGAPFESFLGEGAFGLDSLVVLWWLARRGEGETFLTFDRAASEWPLDLSPDDLEVELDDGIAEDDTHPE